MKSWLGPVLALAILAVGSADAARIVGVQEMTQVQPAPTVNSMEVRRIPKFVDRLETEVTRFEVEWEATAEDAAPLVVQFQFRAQARSDAPITSLRQPYERIEAGRRLTKFTLPSGQRVAAWRVRLVQGQRVLAERVSATWN
jgi:hypothetical protein